ncbi:MAG: hypothetical protein KGL02_12690, partial [Acidobacteriota bacterium]|nr:hypothetical protein [Acidobacteriota bacterium]
MAYILFSWIAAYTAVWALDRVPFVRNCWIRFSAATDTPFFRGAYPELRLAVIAFGIAFIGVVLGFMGSFGSSYFRPLEILAVAGFIVTAFGVFLG